jgi:integrase/recombinase XerD
MAVIMLTVKADPGSMNAMTGRSSGESSALTLAVAGFLETCRSENTATAYRTDLRHFAAWCASGEALNLLTADAADVARYRTACELEGASAATVARRLSAIMSFAGYAAEQGFAPELSGSSAVERPTLESASTAHALSDADAQALLDAADKTSMRAGVLIRLLMLDGLKMGEVVAADVSDLHGRPPRMTLGVARRGGPALTLHPDTTATVCRYLGTRRDGALLLTEQRGQPGKRLTRFGADYLIKQIAHTAGLASTISANTLRRRYVIDAHARGTDLEEIRHNVGHSAQRTTRRYLSTDADAKSEDPPARR